MNLLDPWTDLKSWQALDFLADILGVQARELRHGKVSLQAPGRPVVRLFPSATAALAWVEAQLAPPANAPAAGRRARQG